VTSLNPANTTVNDICMDALRECGQIGVGQTALAQDLNDAWARLQWMLQQWNKKRWLVYHDVIKLLVSSGSVTYTVGPGGQIDTGANTQRPDKIEAAFLRQITQSQPNQIDYPLDLLQSMEDYSKIALKQLSSFPGMAFYDPSFPLGTLYTWPVPQANIYSVGIVIKDFVQSYYATSATVFNLPAEYYPAMMYNLALRLRTKYQIPTFPGDPLMGLAKDALGVLRGANTAIARLQMPAEMNRPGIYNIFSDRSY